MRPRIFYIYIAIHKIIYDGCHLLLNSFNRGDYVDPEPAAAKGYNQRIYMRPRIMYIYIYIHAMIYDECIYIYTYMQWYMMNAFY